MGDTESDFRDPYVEDAKHAREQETERLRIQARERQDRREWWEGVLAGLAVVLVIVAIIAGITFGVLRSNANDLKIEQEHTKTEQEHTKVVRDCLDRGYSWMSGNCINTGGTR